MAIRARVKSVTYEAEGILSFDLRAIEGTLPPFTAGAHVDVQLPNKMSRSYSLCNDPRETHRYVIAVNRDQDSRGGSKHMHDQVRAGDVLTITAPANNFALDEGAAHTALIAGGIGITPLWCMAQRLAALGKPFELWYLARTRKGAAFLEELAPLGERVHLNFDHEPGGAMLDIAKLVATVPRDAHLYCCGPNPMLTAFEAATADRPQEFVHVEYFSAKEAPAVAGGYTVTLARSKRNVVVAPGQTILDALLDAGVDVPYSCMEGVCASCETKVLEGIPDHRDQVLTKAEQAANRTMMICCSGSKTPTLVLDL